MSAAAERRELLELILRYGFEKRRVVLSSGRESDFYLDLRATLMRPRGIELAGRLLFERLAAGPRVEAVGGMVVAAVPVVSAVLLAAAARGGAAWADLAGFFVRKEAKQHGLGKRIEGAFRAGQTVALVEDTMTTGGSTLAALDAVEAAGGKVTRVLCIVDRSEGAADAFAGRGLVLEPLFTRADLPI